MAITPEKAMEMLAPQIDEAVAKGMTDPTAIILWAAQRQVDLCR